MGPQHIALADDPLFVSALPLEKFWYAARWIYAPVDLRRLRSDGLMRDDVLRTMDPVYLRPADTRAVSAVGDICAGLWRDTGMTIRSRRILSCGSSRLRTLYGL